MAPELRKRKVLPEAKQDVSTKTKVEGKATTKTKRKAVDEVSPVSLKKQKPAKKTSSQPNKKPAKEAVESKQNQKPAKKTSSQPNKKPAKAAVESKQPKKTAKPVQITKEEEEIAPKSPVDGSASEDEEDGGVLLLADELDSSDDDATDTTSLFKPGQDVGNIPAISAEVCKAAIKPAGERGVIYVGRIPHGFYEYEMRQYMSQFGPITRLRLSRNPKTGASRHFAFIEFEEASTAEIVAKTMNNYLLFGHLLKVKVVPPSELHKDVFKGANTKFKKVPWNKMAGKKLEKPHTKAAWEAKVGKEQVAREEKLAKLKAIGYEFEAPAFKDVPPPAPKIVESEDQETSAIESAPTLSEAVDGAALPKGQVDQTDKAQETETVTTIPPTKTKAKAKAKTSKSTKSKKRAKA
ncbi:hypothetical protein CDD82_2184 [Ophiocordyceps australis]|uniref:RRM domain-containing protein n=1 Tax=Ophiocordyceps australis TaxID=1399860 RepID=A0A2C5XFV7_9HYPO|nr:hypothetical protein CDD82_2184 [Ophiocordyceps australis]